MKKAAVFLFALLLPFLTVNGQAKKGGSSLDAIMCGKIGEGGPTGGKYTIAELKVCDLKITPVDTNLTIVEFQLTIVAKSSSYPSIEKKIIGNEIPKEYRDRIYGQALNVFIEAIHAVNKNGVKVTMNPIAIRLPK